MKGKIVNVMLNNRGNLVAGSYYVIGDNGQKISEGSARVIDVLDSVAGEVLVVSQKKRDIKRK